MEIVMANVELEQLKQKVGRAIARHRQACNLTQEQVAERLGIGNEAMSRIERGLVMPNVARLLELATVFQCDASDLLTEASTRSIDQSHYLERLLATLTSQDRELVVEMVEKLVTRLAAR